MSMVCCLSEKTSGGGKNRMAKHWWKKKRFRWKIGLSGYLGISLLLGSRFHVDKVRNKTAYDEFSVSRP